MNEFAKEWVSELRSGKYPQGQNFLCKENKFCCLGVACELYQQKYKDLDLGVDIGGAKTYDDKCSSLPQKVVDKLNLNGYFGDINSQTSLAGLNDAGRTFDEIADAIERHKKSLFKSA